MLDLESGSISMSLKYINASDTFSEADLSAVIELWAMGVTV